jgi:protochlorophyllide reductase
LGLFRFRSGIGLDAAKLLAIINPINRIILVARTREKADAAKEAVVAVIPVEHRKQHGVNVIPMACDHRSLDSVRNFQLDLRRKLDESYHPSKWKLNGIDVLCLNAAVLQKNDSKAEFTEDGFEVTFQTNHLAPFLIANLAMDMINPFGRVVFSTSGLHLQQKLVFDGMVDPKTREAQRGFEMMDGSEFHYKRSYSASKLCNVAICFELNERLRTRGAIANCFSPGLMTTSGMFRHQAGKGDSITAIHSKDVLRKEKTVAWGAGALVYLAIADETGKQGGQYWRDSDSYAASSARYGVEFCSSSISDDHEKRQMLWQLSCQLTGIPFDFRIANSKHHHS